MPEPVSKFIVLVPLRYNDGTPVANEVILEFQEALLGLGCGITIAGTVEGAYRMADGRTQIDHSLQVWIGLAEDRVPELERLVAGIGAKLGQESMYLERTGGQIHFILPPQPEGD